MKITIDVTSGINIFFISDFHLFHKNVILSDNRKPFFNEYNEPDLNLMHETIINNWNLVVRKQDVVFYLGDLTFGKIEETKFILKQLNGKIHFIMGNHDKLKEVENLTRFQSINDYVSLKIFSGDKKDNIHFCLMHYPIFSWDKKYRGNYCIFGHSHHKLDDNEFVKTNRMIDVGCNGINYTPISYKEIIELKKDIFYKNFDNKR